MATHRVIDGKLKQCPEYGRRYREKNKERRQMNAKIYYSKNRERLLKNGREYAKGRSKTDGGFFVRYKFQAKQRGLVFNLTLDEFSKIRSMPCHYCGKPGPNGIDRKDNGKGYDIENSAPCCATHNAMKSSMNEEVFIQECISIANFKGNK